MKNKILIDAIEQLVRDMLPKDCDFSLTVWRMPQDDQLEMWTVSRGNPVELEIVLTDVLTDLKAANARPLTSLTVAH